MDGAMEQKAGSFKLRQYSIVGFAYIVLVSLVLYPIGGLFLSAFRIDTIGEASVWTISNFGLVLSSPEFLRALRVTITLSSEAVVLSTILGVLLAWLVARTDIPFKKALEPLNLIPFYLSSLVGALSWEVLAAPRSGILNLLATRVFGFDAPPLNIYSITGMGLILGLYYTPYVYLFTLGSIQNMDPALEDAGRVSGASTLSTMLRITLPLAGPAILSASILVFILTASIFGVPLVLGGPGRIHTVSTLIWSYLELYPPNYNAAAALSMVLLILTIFLVILQYRILARRKFYTVTGKGYRPRLIHLGRWRWAALGLNVAYLSVILLPFVVLIFVSFVPGWVGGLNFAKFSLDNYNTVLFVNEVTQRGLVNSTIIAVVGASIGVVGFTVLAALITRTILPWRTGLDFIGMSPVAFPGIVLGVGFLVAWIKTPLYGTLWILMLAYVVHFMPTGLRSMSATLSGISPDLDDCARVSGASWFGALRRILMPLIWPGLMSTWLLLFVIFMREVSSSMMLYVHGTETISIALIQIMEYEPQGASAAFGILLTLIILVGVYFFRKLTSMVRVQMGGGQ
jgi:iron(III) transport system permease protein